MTESAEKLPKDLKKMIGLAACMTRKMGEIPVDRLDAILFICDRESFLKDNILMVQSPDFSYMAAENGVNLLYRGTPWLTMAMMATGKERKELFAEEDERNFSGREIRIMDMVAEKGIGIEDPLRWREKTLETGGPGAIISFDGFDRTMFSRCEADDRALHRRLEKGNMELMASLEAEISGKSGGKPEKSWMDRYRVVNLRNPVAGIILRRFFAGYDFRLESFPDEGPDQPLPLFEARGEKRGVEDIESCRACENPFIVVKIEDGFPSILEKEGCFGGFSSRAEAMEAIRADMENMTPWLVTMHQETWQEPYWMLTALPRVFKSHASAFKWLKENCGFTDLMRVVRIFVDGIDTAYIEDLPGRRGWRIARAEIS